MTIYLEMFFLDVIIIIISLKTTMHCLHANLAVQSTITHSNKIEELYGILVNK